MISVLFSPPQTIATNKYVIHVVCLMNHFISLRPSYIQHRVLSIAYLLGWQEQYHHRKMSNMKCQCLKHGLACSGTLYVPVHQRNKTLQNKSQLQIKLPMKQTGQTLLNRIFNALLSFLILNRYPCIFRRYSS